MEFADRLTSKMKERDSMSVRRLGAMWRPDNPESGRRNIHKYLRGQEPSQRIVGEIADALGVPVEELMGDPDDADEEADATVMVQRLLLEVQSLVARIDKAERRKKAAA